MRHLEWLKKNLYGFDCDNIGDMTADALADIHNRCGIEESDENYEKVKAWNECNEE